MTEKRKDCTILETNLDKLGININEKKMKSSAHNDLLLVMTNDMSFGLVDKANGIGYPKGGTRTTCGILMQCFESQTNASRV